MPRPISPKRGHNSNYGSPGLLKYGHLNTNNLNSYHRCTDALRATDLDNSVRLIVTKHFEDPHKNDKKNIYNLNRA